MNSSRLRRLRGSADWIAGQQSQTIDQLTRWCDQNSSSLDVANLRSMAQMLVEDFGDREMVLDRIELPELKLLGDSESWQRQPTGPLLAWHHNAGASQRVLLMIHYDTVYPSGSPPDRCHREGNRLVGPGTADAKGGIAVIRLAAQAILKFGLAEDLGLSVILNPDEEIGSTASAETIHSIASDFDLAMVFEPTLPDGSLVAARKGSGNFAIVVRGRSAHAGRNPDDGRNAIVHLAKLVSEVAELHRPDDGVLVNVGRITGGGPLNRVPDHAAVQLNIRVTDPKAMASARQSLDNIANRFSSDDYRVSLHGDFHSPPKLVDAAARAVQARVERAGKFAGRHIRWQDTGGACDGSKLAAWGLPNVDTMGVCGGALHSPEEFCDLDSLVPAAVTVAAVIAELASDLK